MSEYEVIKKVMESTINDDDKVFFIKKFLLHWFKEEDIKWIWEADR